MRLHGRQVPLSVGVEHESDCVEVIRWGFAGRLKEQQLLWIVDFYPELAEHIASQGSYDRRRSFV